MTGEKEITSQEIDKIIDNVWFFGMEVVREFNEDGIRTTYVKTPKSKIVVEDWMLSHEAYLMRDLVKLGYEKGFSDCFFEHIVKL